MNKLYCNWPELSFWSADLRSKSCSVLIKIVTCSKVHLSRKQRSEVMQGCDDFTFNVQTLRARNNYTNVIIGSKFICYFLSNEIGVSVH